LEGGAWSYLFNVRNTESEIGCSGAKTSGASFAVGLASWTVFDSRFRVPLSQNSSQYPKYALQFPLCEVHQRRQRRKREAVVWRVQGIEEQNGELVIAQMAATELL